MSDVIHMPSGGCPALPRGRLIFSCDATGSRAPTWSIARKLQMQMFREAAPIGKLDLQLVFFGGNGCAPPNGRRAASSWRNGWVESIAIPA